MEHVRALLKHLSAERVGWFGAGLSAAALSVVGYQLLLASLFMGPLPEPQPTPIALGPPSATATRTSRSTSTPFPTNTPHPTPTPTRRPTRTPTRTPTSTRTPTPGVPDVVATLTSADPDAIVGAVATFVTRTRDSLDSLSVTPRPR